MKNRITDLFQIQYPIVQAGMIWCSGWKLASAACESGCLGIIGAGSMYPEILEEHIEKLQDTTDKPFGVNVPLLYPDIEKLMAIIVRRGVKVVITSAGKSSHLDAKTQRTRNHSGSCNRQHEICIKGRSGRG